MRVLWTMDYDVWKDGPVGGCLYSTRALVEGLKERGHTVTTMNPVWRRDNPLPWYVETVTTAKRFARGLRNALEDNPPTVVIAQNHIYPYVVKEAKRAGVPVVIVARDERYRCPNFAHSYQHGCDKRCAHCVGKMALIPYPWFRHHINMMREMTVEADAQIVPSEFIAHDMRTWLQGTFPVVIPPPVDDEHIPEVWEPKDVLFLGKGVYKGADIVIKIAKAMQDDPFRFRICGKQNSDHEAEFKKLPNVDYLGFVDRKEAFRRAAVVVAPARWPEPAARNVAEAVYMGVPCIISNEGGVPETMGPGGMIVDRVDDIDQWVMNIRAMMVSDRWHKYSNEARRHGYTMHKDFMAERLEGVLEAVST